MPATTGSRLVERTKSLPPSPSRMDHYPNRTSTTSRPYFSRPCLNRPPSLRSLQAGPEAAALVGAAALLPPPASLQSRREQPFYRRTPSSHQQQHQQSYLSPTSYNNTRLSTPVIMIDIAPGVSEPLRGSAETMQAMEDDAITQVHCLTCSESYLCIQDAAYFICPVCRVVNPVPHGSWGVGLGLGLDQY